jgi:hypothetical protein
MSGEGAPASDAAAAAAAPKPEIHEALQRLVMTSGAADGGAIAPRRANTRLSCAAQTRPRAADGRCALRAHADPSPRHVVRRLDALQRRHAFWETQPVVQFNDAGSSEARAPVRAARQRCRSLRGLPGARTSARNAPPAPTRRSAGGGLPCAR